MSLLLVNLALFFRKLDIDGASTALALQLLSVPCKSLSDITNAPLAARVKKITCICRATRACIGICALVAAVLESIAFVAFSIFTQKVSSFARLANVVSALETSVICWALQAHLLVSAIWQFSAVS
jgi:uncharacterized membrane protein (GlpM family)